MNNMDDLDKYIKNLSKKVEVPKDIYSEAYDNLRKENNKKINVMKLVASLSIIVLVVLGVIFYKNFLTNVEKEDNNDVVASEEQVSSYGSESSLPKAAYSITTYDSDNIKTTFINPMDDGFLDDIVEYVAVIKLNRILKYSNYCEKLDTYTSFALTYSDVSLEKNIKGDLPQKFEMLSVGGILSISQMEKSFSEEQIIKHNFNELSDNEKDTTYVRVFDTISMNMPKLEEGKYYLVYMKYSENFERYQVLDQLIYEYDIENNLIKDFTTNEWIKYEYKEKGSVNSY